MKNIKHWSKYFVPPPQIDGIDVGDDFDEGRAAPLYIYWPVTATILSVHYCNSGTNRSLIELQGTYGNSMITRTEVFVDEKGAVTESIPIFSELSAGYQLECDIEIDKGFGIAQRELQQKNVAVCNLFGGITNYGFMTPEGTTNSGGGRFRNGDRVVVQFIGGDISKPIITAYYPHPLNTEDGPRFYPGAPETGFTGRIEGTRINVNKSGVFIDTSEAGIQRLVDPKTGEVTDVHPNRKIVEADDDTQQPLGAFQLTTKSNILVDASYEDEDVNVGDILLQSKTQGTFKSEIENINIYTDSNEKDVILQEKHGSLRDAARKNDKIKITSGDNNDLFAWCARVSNVLDEVGNYLIMAGGPDPGLDNVDLIYAGNLLVGLSVGLPTYAEGRIIEGSPYVQVAGVPTGPDNNDADLQQECAEQVEASFITTVTGSECIVNNISAYFDAIDDLASIIEILEIPSIVNPAPPPARIPSGVPFPYQVLPYEPVRASDQVRDIKKCLVKWLATCPEDVEVVNGLGWPPKFAQLIGPIFSLGTDASAWLALALDPAAWLEMTTSLLYLISGSVCEDFDIKTETIILTEYIADGTINAESNGAYDEAIVTCLDEKMSS